MSVLLRPRPLTREAFAPYGDVVELEGAFHFSINAGWAERFNDLAGLDVAAAGGRAGLSIFRAKPRPMPMALSLVERHLLGSQCFFPVSDQPFYVLVAPPGAPPHGPEQLAAFVSNGRQGVNYRAGTWHHPLLVAFAEADFLVIDRIGPTIDCEEHDIGAWDLALDAAPG